MVEIGGAFHVDVQQKVPLNADRDNVRPAYLKALRAEVVNHAYDLLSKEQAAEKWVDDALETKRITGEAVNAVLDRRYGTKRVIADPSDREGTNIAVARGYTVIPPRAFSKGAWEQVRAHQAALPAGQVTPPPKPFSAQGKPLSVIDEADWTDPQRRVAAYAVWLYRELMGSDIQVRITDDRGWQFAAAYGPDGGFNEHGYGHRGRLILSVPRLGRSWWQRIGAHTDRLLIHEAAHGHRKGSNHLSEGYHDALCDLGARFVQLALDQPDKLRAFRG